MRRLEPRFRRLEERAARGCKRAQLAARTASPLILHVEIFLPVTHHMEHMNGFKRKHLAGYGNL
jgi:hypothetical protein